MMTIIGARRAREVSKRLPMTISLAQWTSSKERNRMVQKLTILAVWACITPLQTSVRKRVAPLSTSLTVKSTTKSLQRQGQRMTRSSQGKSGFYIMTSSIKMLTVVVMIVFSASSRKSAQGPIPTLICVSYVLMVVLPRNVKWLTRLRALTRTIFQSSRSPHFLRINSLNNKWRPMLLVNSVCSNNSNSCSSKTSQLSSRTSMSLCRSIKWCSARSTNIHSSRSSRRILVPRTSCLRIVPTRISPWYRLNKTRWTYPARWSLAITQHRPRALLS